MCENFEKGYCPYGARCMYQHFTSYTSNLENFCLKVLAASQKTGADEIVDSILQQQSNFKRLPYFKSAIKKAQKQANRQNDTDSPRSYDF